jgi:Xaa-Pro aminopeptidase
MGIFSAAEMRRRVDLVSDRLQERGVNAALLHSADNVYYVTGVPLLSAWGRPMLAVVTIGDKPTVIGSLIEKPSMERYGEVAEVRAYGDEENVWNASIEIACGLLKGATSSGPVGVERRILPVGVYESLESRLDRELVDVSDILADARLLKSDEEIRLLRTGGEIAKVGASAFIEAVRPGATELAVAAHAVAEMDRALAALYPEGATSSYAYCHVGDHTLSPHLHPTGRRIQPGDLIALNVFPVIWGYCMELERTFVIGPPSDDQRRALTAVGESFDLAKRLLRPGTVISDIHADASVVLRRHGFEKNIRHGTGHAHGIMIGAAGREEGGEIRSYNHGLLHERMVNSIEPGVYLPELGGFRHSDVMLITPDGADCLTEFPTEIAL